MKSCGRVTVLFPASVIVDSVRCKQRQSFQWLSGNVKEEVIVSGKVHALAQQELGGSEYRRSYRNDHVCVRRLMVIGVSRTERPFLERRVIDAC